HNLHQGNNTPILDSLAAFSKSVDGTVPCTALRNAFVARHSSLVITPRKLYSSSEKSSEKSPQNTKSFRTCDPEKRFCAFEEMKFALIELIIDNRSNFHKSQDILISKRVFSTMIKKFKDKMSVNEDNGVFLIAWIKVSRILHIGTWDPLI
uniref:Uncharacterized protein n=1 Tax=Glossina palpalis gambiensis TaxID=67801 RepID=A0A1B0B3B6_9MUSC